MYTYQFCYDEKIDGYGSIQFCAVSENEARKLFREWKRKNGYNIRKYTISVIYNKEDQEEYEYDYIDPRNGGVNYDKFNIFIQGKTKS